MTPEWDWIEVYTSTSRDPKHWAVRVTPYNLEHGGRIEVLLEVFRKDYWDDNEVISSGETSIPIEPEQAIKIGQMLITAAREALGKPRGWPIFIELGPEHSAPFRFIDDDAEPLPKSTPEEKP